MPKFKVDWTETYRCIALIEAPSEHNAELGVRHAINDGVEEELEGFDLMYSDVVVNKVMRKPVLHTFGGIVFEETGENRAPRSGEWYLTDGNGVPCYKMMTGTFPRKILRPIRVEV